MVVFGNGFGDKYVALDPYRVLIPYPNGSQQAGTSGLVGNPQTNKWTVEFSPAQSLNTSEFPRNTTTNAIPGVTIMQENSGGTDVFYGTLVEINKNNSGDVVSMVFTSPATAPGVIGQYNFVSTRNLYIGGYYNTATNNVVGAQVISNGNISTTSHLNLGNTGTPLTPQSAGFPTPYTSISSATFQASDRRVEIQLSNHFRHCSFKICMAVC